MQRRNLIVVGMIALVILVAGGLWAYDFVLGETEEASAPIEAVPLELEPTSPPATEPVVFTPENTEVTPVEQATATPGAAALAETGAGLTVYTIQQSASEVRFTIYEELRGAPTDVVGVSDQVAGEIAVDLSDLSTAQVGELLINARTLATDQDRRNQAIRNRILFTDSYEFIRFAPTQVRGLSGSAAPGDSFTFEIAGDLTIKDISQPVVFNVTAQLDSAGQISGTASATIQRAQYDLGIPNVPGVANVGEEVLLEIDFTAASAA